MNTPKTTHNRKKATPIRSQPFNRKRPSPWLVGLFLMFVLSLGVITVYPWIMLSWLGRSSPPKKVDLIVVFSGGGGCRFRHAITLLRAGFANKILFIGTQAEMRFAKSTVASETAELDGQMVFVRPNVKNTFASARFLRDYVVGQRLGQIIIVTSFHHGRRVEACFSKLLHGSSFSRTYCPPSKEKADATTTLDLWKEVGKNLWYSLRY